MSTAAGKNPQVALLTPLTGLHAQVLDLLGLAVTEGELVGGSVIRIEELETRHGVSRSMIREALRVLASMGMVASRRRVGVQRIGDEDVRRVHRCGLEGVQGTKAFIMQRILQRAAPRL